MKAIEQYFHVVLFIISGEKGVIETLVWLSDESYWELFSRATVLLCRWTTEVDLT